METVKEIKPEVLDTSGTKPIKRHIVQRDTPGGQMGQQALCGAEWDVAHPTTGELCQKCVEIYQKKHPGWPLPR